MMIFRFFLQSNEYQFFIRRLKNVSMTKMSLKQLRSNESVINQRHDVYSKKGPEEEPTSEYNTRSIATNSSIH